MAEQFPPSDQPPPGELLLYQTEDGNTRIECRFAEDSIWLTQRQISELFQTSVPNINQHLKTIYEDGELKPDTTIKKYLIVQTEGYDPSDEASMLFFKTVQNKMHWAAHGHTAAEIIFERTDASQPNSGLTSWAGDQLRKTDVSIAKNYLNQDELNALNRIVTAYLEFAEVQALNRTPMTMANWIIKLDEFLNLSGRELLDHAGKISHDQAKLKAETAFEIYRQKQANLPGSVDQHFDQSLNDLKRLKKKNDSDP